MFKATLKFPKNYPDHPPTLRITSKFWHPNVYEDGKVCISILHPPGDDQFGYEQSSERWLPIHSVESILVSVISSARSLAARALSPCVALAAVPAARARRHARSRRLGAACRQ